MNKTTTIKALFDLFDNWLQSKGGLTIPSFASLQTESYRTGLPGNVSIIFKQENKDLEVYLLTFSTKDFSFTVEIRYSDRWYTCRIFELLEDDDLSKIFKFLKDWGYIS